MPDALTEHFDFTKPEVGASDDSWGTKFNNNLDAIDAAIFNRVAKAGDTMTGTLINESTGWSRAMEVRNPAGTGNASIGFKWGDGPLYTFEVRSAVGPQVRNSDLNTALAIFDPADDVLTANDSIVTRRKGDVRYLRKAGGVDLENWLGFGSTAVATVFDLSRHLRLYGSIYGLNVTASRLNIVAPETAFHQFVLGESIVARVEPRGTAMPVDQSVVTKEKGDSRYFPRADADLRFARVGTVWDNYRLVLTQNDINVPALRVHSTSEATVTQLQLTSPSITTNVRFDLRASGFFLYNDTDNIPIIKFDINNDATAPEWGVSVITMNKGDARYSKIGVGQTWQDFTANRVKDTNYRNTTGTATLVAVRGDSGARFEVSSDGSTWIEILNIAGSSGTAVIPNNWWYHVTNGNFSKWMELK
jgi:hypothetical protein